MHLRDSQVNKGTFPWPLNITLVPFGLFSWMSSLKEKAAKVQEGYVYPMLQQVRNSAFKTRLAQFLHFSDLRSQKLPSWSPATWTTVPQLWTYPPSCLQPASPETWMDSSLLLFPALRGQLCCERSSSPHPATTGASGIRACPGACYYCDGPNGPFRTCSVKCVLQGLWNLCTL